MFPHRLLLLLIRFLFGNQTDFWSDFFILYPFPLFFSGCEAVKLLNCIAVSYLFDSFIDSCCYSCFFLIALLSSSKIALKSVPCSYCGETSHTVEPWWGGGLVLVYDGFQCFSCASLCPDGCCCVSSPFSSPAEGRGTEWGWTSGELWAMRQGCTTLGFAVSSG